MQPPVTKHASLRSKSLIKKYCTCVRGGGGGANKMHSLAWGGGDKRRRAQDYLILNARICVTSTQNIYVSTDHCVIWERFFVQLEACRFIRYAAWNGMRTKNSSMRLLLHVFCGTRKIKKLDGRELRRVSSERTSSVEYGINQIF